MVSKLKLVTANGVSQTGKANSLRRTLDFWQRRTHRRLTVEEAREIETNVTGFFRILKEWASTELDDTESDK